MPTLRSLLSNLPLAARRLLRARGFTLVAVTTLAVAIGANVAIFGLVEILFLRPLPVEKPGRLVAVYESRDGSGFHPLSYADFLSYRRETTTLESLAAAYLGAPLELRTGGEPAFLEGAVVSAEFFRTLGLEARYGRFFDDAEDAGPGREPVAVVSRRLWRERFDDRPDVLGETLDLNGTTFTIVGVAPEVARSSLRLGSAIDVWIPTSLADVGYRWCDALDHDCTWMSLVGRLAPGSHLEDAQSELSLLSASLRAEFPSSDAVVRGVRVTPLGPLHPDERSRSLRLAGTLLLAVSLLLVVAAASLSGLLVARGLSRRREVSVRLAMGASRSDVLSLFLAETLLLGLAGGAGSILTASWFAGLLSRFFASREPLELSLAPGTFLFALLLSVATGLALGLAPGLQASRRGLSPGGAGRTEGRRPRILGGLVVAQTALALVLLTGTGLLLSSIDTIRHAGAFEPDRVATLRLRPRLLGLGPQRAQAMTREVVERLEGVPGVRSVALSTHFTPGRGNFVPVTPVGATDPNRGVEAATQPVSPSFFETVGAPLLRGREIDEGDRPDTPPVAVVNRTLAETLWPNRPALGESLVAFDRELRVVGVVDDSTIHLDPIDAPVPQLYLAYWQDREQIDSRLMVRTSGSAGPMLATLRTAIEDVSRQLPVTEAEVLSTRLRRTFTPTWLAGRVLATTGALSLLLCALCLHGVLGLLVARRRKELGVRLAIGATRREIVTLVVRDALSLAGLGAVLGLALSQALGRLLEAYLFQVSPEDPGPIVAATLLLALTAAAAAWWPARRASRVDPTVALRGD